MNTNTNFALRIAFDCSVDDARWTGGVSYFRNLFAAVRQADVDRQIGLYMLATNTRNTEFDAYLDKKILYSRDHRRTLWRRAWRQLQIRLPIGKQPSHPVKKVLKEHNVNAVFSRDHFGTNLDTPLAVWIPDFQRLHYPEMFSTVDLENAEKQFQSVVQYADRIILSSDAAYADFAELAPDGIHKARILKFAAQVPQEVYAVDPQEVVQRYHLPDKFIYLPNQFWAHKNHSVVIEALSKIRNRNKRVSVVCTGNTSDYRNQQFFGTLLAEVSAKGVRDDFIILGLVPKNHVYQIMRRAIAVLQPSLFEGWSTTIEEGKSLGKRFLLSDIPVHREQAPADAELFAPTDADSLAEKLVSIYETYPAGPDSIRESTARVELSGRVQRFGTAFVDIMKGIAK